MELVTADKVSNACKINRKASNQKHLNSDTTSEPKNVPSPCFVDASRFTRMNAGREAC